MPREHSYNSGRIRRANEPGETAAPQTPPAREAPPAQPTAPQRPEPEPSRLNAAYTPGQNRAARTAYDVEQEAAPRREAPPQRMEQQVINVKRKPAAKQPRMEQQVVNVKRRPAPAMEVFEELEPEWDADEYLPPPAPKKPKRRRWGKAVVSLLVVFAILGTAVLLALNYLGDVFDPGEFGLTERITLFGRDGVPKAYNKKELLHIVIVGIDNEEGRSYGAGLGLTDMILYCRFDLKNNQLNMLQVPRDSFIGDEYPTNGTGKINALLISGPDKDNPINNFTTPFQQQFKLPVDYYVAMDMDAMKHIVNTFGGIKVYVPRTMSYGGSELEEGWRWLDGDAAEFFVRNRHGAGFERGDIDRLDNQRHFYSALFRRFLNLKPKDIPGLLSVFHHYCNTDIPLGDLYSIAVSGLSLTAESVMFCKAPGATGDGLDPSGQNRNNYYLDLYGRGTEQDPGLASLLNQYFRDAEDPVPAEELLLPQIRIPESVALYPPNVQVMSSVQEGEGGADVDVEPGA